MENPPSFKEPELDQQAPQAASGARLPLRKLRAILTKSNDASRERYRRAALAGITSVSAKAVSLAVSLITVRLTVHYLGAERYGVWMTISSAVAMLGFADFGMSNGVVNLVAGALGSGDRRAARQAISSGFWMLMLIASAFLVLAACTYPFLDPARLFNVHSALAKSEAGPALLVLIATFLCNLPLGIVRGTQTGMQDAARNNLWILPGTITSLLCLLVAIHLHAGLPLLIVALSGPQVLFLVINGLALFGGRNRDLRPGWRALNWATSRHLFRVGGMFFLLQASYSVGMQTDNVVIAHILGASAVTPYAVPARLFNTVNALLVMASAAVWPAYSDALSRRDGPWIRRTFRRVSTFGLLATAAATAVFVLFGKFIILHWVGPSVQVSTTILLIFALNCFVYAYLQPIGFMLNALSEFRLQAWCSVLMAIVNLGLSIAFVHRYGILGAVLGTTVAQLVVQAIPLTIATRRILDRLDPPSTQAAAKTL